MTTIATQATSFQAAADSTYPVAEQPTIYFIGVTTGKSSIMKVFPRWAEALGLGDATIVGIDCKLHDDPRVYRRIVEHIRHDPLSLGALVTTHKLDLLRACRDLFHHLDPWATLIGEVSSISKRDGAIIGHAKDPITAGLSLEAIIPEREWGKTGGTLCLLGAGGSSSALTCYLLDCARAGRPKHIIVTARGTARLDELKYLHDRMGRTTEVSYVLCPQPRDNDAVVTALPPHSLVANATGLGKDAPGSPLTDAVAFPEDGYAWDFNYRGDLIFLDQARKQANTRRLTVEDGWVYFLHGWTRVIAEVFDVEIPTHGPVFEDLSRIAHAAR